MPFFLTAIELVISLVLSNSSSMIFLLLLVFNHWQWLNVSTFNFSIQFFVLWNFGNNKAKLVPLVSWYLWIISSQDHICKKQRNKRKLEENAYKKAMQKGNKNPTFLTGFLGHKTKMMRHG